MSSAGRPGPGGTKHEARPKVQRRGYDAAAMATLAIILPAALALAGEVTPKQSSLSGVPSRPTLPQNAADSEIAFVFDTFAPAIEPGMRKNCPHGYAGTSSENYLASLPAAERVRLSRAENEMEFAERWKASTLGPNNTNLCSNYNLFPNRPLQRTVQGRTSDGIDLDGDDAKSASSKGCAHESFVSPDGRRGIDNQAYRAMGCTRTWRGLDGSPSDMRVGFDSRLRTGEHTIVLILRRVDNLERDDDVEVVIASSLDAPIIDTQARLVPGASFEVSANPRWRTVLRGKIADGVLLTEAKSITLRHPLMNGEGPRAVRSEWQFDDSRLRVRIGADGSLKGVLAGYMPFRTLLDRQVNAGVGAAQTVNMDCAAAFNTLQQLADGGRDPRTGQCTTISTVFEVSAVRAFVTDRRDQKITHRH
jgi:hypothetical protein